MSVPASPTISRRAGWRARERRSAAARRRRGRAIIRSAGASSYSIATVTRWPSARRTRAQRAAVVRLPPLDWRFAGVISVIRMVSTIEIPEVQRVPAAWLADIVRDARATTLAFVRDLDAGQLMGPKLDIVNPLLWEIGHVAWFQHHFVRRWLDDRAPLLPGTRALYDSMRVAHDDRWDLTLPSLDGTLRYLTDVCETVLARLDQPLASPRDSYLYQLLTFHADKAHEALASSRRTRGYRAPR